MEIELGFVTRWRTQPEPVFQMLISLHAPQFKPTKKTRRAAHPHLGYLSPQGLPQKLSRKGKGPGAVKMCYDLSSA